MLWCNLRSDLGFVLACIAHSAAVETTVEIVRTVDRLDSTVLAETESCCTFGKLLRCGPKVAFRK